MPKTILLLATLSLLAVSAHSQQPPKPPQVPAKQQADSALKLETSGKGNTQRAAESLPPPPLSVAPSGNRESQHKPQHSEENASEFWTVVGHRMKITDTLLVVFTFILAVATIYLWRATRDLVEGAEETAKRQLRAYVGRDGDPKDWQEVRHGDTAAYQFKIRLKNTGQTPAYHVRGHCRALLYPVRLPPSEDFDATLAVFPEAVAGTLGPGQTLPMICSSGDLDKNELDWIHAKKTWNLFLTGKVTYEDAFGRLHALRFCEGVEWGQRGVTTYLAERYNEAD